MTDNRYVIDGGPKGKERLGLLARAVGPTTARLFDQGMVRTGMHVLDVGCGGGNVTLELARRVGPQGRAIGIDADAIILELARTDAAIAGLRNVEFRHGDARESVEPSGFDLVYARFLLSHLAKPEQTLASMIRATRPGGLVIVEDIEIDAIFCYPACSAFTQCHDLYARVVRHNGGDPNIGPKLAHMFLQAGLATVGVQVVQPVHREGECKGIAQVTLERIAAAVTTAGLASPAELATLAAELHHCTARADTIMSLPRIFQVWGVRPT